MYPFVWTGKHYVYLLFYFPGSLTRCLRQTSSGKTYTTSHLLSSLSSTLFPSLASFAQEKFAAALLGQGKKAEEAFEVSLAIWEILGSEAKDLGKGRVGEKVVVGEDQVSLPFRAQGDL